MPINSLASVLRGWYCALLLLWLPALHAAIAPADIPAPLRGWEAWVLHGEEFRNCPFYAREQPGRAAAHVCALPGNLDIRIANGRAELSQEVRVYAAGYHDLTHARGALPEALTVDGVALPALSGGSGPRVWLEPGLRRLRFELDLATRPDALTVPTAQRLLSLQVDGSPVFPLLRQGQNLWLQQRVEVTENDAVEVVVHRLLRDGVPMELVTRVRLHVAGKAREIRLGPAWPEGFELTLVRSRLPVVVEGGRMLRVQAGAGSHELTLNTRASTMVETLAWQSAAGDWPQQETLSFAADHSLRVLDLEGLTAVDPAQSDVPEEWREYPTYLLGDGEKLSLTVRSRGIGDDANRLRLNRQIWLDFDGSGYTIQDRIEGQMRKGFRLDLAPPFTLLSASDGGETLLVTNSVDSDGRGVELRSPSLQFDSTARSPRSTRIPVHGWNERMDSANLSLNLPPGYRLLHAGGVDRAPRAWSMRWTIYSVFIAAFATALGFRLGGWPLGAALAAFMLLSTHELDAPRYSLIVLLLILLGWRHLADGRLRRLTQAAGILAGLAFIVVALPFALAQGRHALHPQLALDQARFLPSASYNVDGFANNQGPQMQLAEPAAPQARSLPAPVSKSEDQQQTLESITVTGSSVKRQSIRERYSKDAVLQAGIGRPNWSWQSLQLGFDGPVERQQSLSLWIVPPWLMATWRLAILLTLAAWVWLALGAVRSRRSGVGLGAMVLLLTSSSAFAQPSTPDPALLKELKERLSQAPPCVPDCARFADATLRINGDSVLLALPVHAGERVLVPLPLDDSALAQVQISVDGSPAPLLGSGSGQGWTVVERGLHRLELRARLRGDRLTLQFPWPPSRMTLDAPGFNVSGLRDGRLTAGRLELNREAPASHADSGSASPARMPIKPFVQIERSLSIDLDWEVHTVIRRIAPADGGFSVQVPLIAGELPADSSLPIESGMVTVTLQPGQREADFGSRLPRSERIVLTAPDLNERNEVWRVSVSPSFSVRSSGVPSDSGDSDAQSQGYRPLPGESLTLDISRPTPVTGATLVADQVDLRTEVGARSRTHTLSLSLRATQGGNHPLRLPADAELLNLSSDGRPLNLRPENGVLMLPVRPGQQTVLLSWREDAGAQLRVRTPQLDLGMDAANIALRLSLPAERWLLGLRGPAVGPAVLYWSGLLVLLAVGVALGRSRRALLSTPQWLLLVLGFSTFSWGAFLLVVLAFIALDARARHVLPEALGPWRFDLLQLALTGLTLAAFIALISAIPNGLLGSPSMHIAGGYDHYGSLSWLADRSTGELPTASAISLPMWLYKALMLAFALWLAQALIGWIKRAWQALTQGGGWLTLARTPKVTESKATPQPLPSGPESTA